jgi:hypothetical protein
MATISDDPQVLCRGRGSSSGRPRVSVEGVGERR